MGRAAAVRRARDVPRWHREADVVIAGFGAAGACTAIEAAGCGAEVLVLERASGGGGTSALSTGQIYLGAGAPIQSRCGFEDSPEGMCKYLLAACGPGPDEAKIRSTASAASSTCTGSWPRACRSRTPSTVRAPTHPHRRLPQ
jgi:succinate dehydrogenase/fumarate reductase flavoprotein subunit